MAADSWETLFQIADQDKDGQVGGQEAIGFFKRTGLPKNVLAEVWFYADTQKNGFLTRPEFFVALQLATIAQAGGQVNPDVARAVISGGLGRVQPPLLAGLELAIAPPPAGLPLVHTGSVNGTAMLGGGPGLQFVPTGSMHSLGNPSAHMAPAALQLLRARSMNTSAFSSTTGYTVGPGVVPFQLPRAASMSYSGLGGLSGPVSHRGGVMQSGSKIGGLDRTVSSRMSTGRAGSSMRWAGPGGGAGGVLPELGPYSSQTGWAGAAIPGTTIVSNDWPGRQQHAAGMTAMAGTVSEAVAERREARVQVQMLPQMQQQGVTVQPQGEVVDGVGQFPGHADALRSFGSQKQITQIEWNSDDKATAVAESVDNNNVDPFGGPPFRATNPANDIEPPPSTKASGNLAIAVMVQQQGGVIDGVGQFSGHADALRSFGSQKQIAQAGPLPRLASQKQIAEIGWNSADKATTIAESVDNNDVDPFGGPPFRATNPANEQGSRDIEPPPSTKASGNLAIAAMVQPQGAAVDGVGQFPGHADALRSFGSQKRIAQAGPIPRLASQKQIAEIEWNSADKATAIAESVDNNDVDPFGGPPFRATNPANEQGSGVIQPPPYMKASGNLAIKTTGARAFNRPSRLSRDGHSAVSSPRTTSSSDDNRQIVTPSCSSTDPQAVDNPFGGDTFVALLPSPPLSSAQSRDQTGQQQVGGRLEDKTSGSDVLVALTQPSAGQQRENERPVAMKPSPEGRGNAWPPTSTAASPLAARQAELNYHEHSSQTDRALVLLGQGSEMVSLEPATHATAVAPTSHVVSVPESPQVAMTPRPEGSGNAWPTTSATASPLAPSQPDLNSQRESISHTALVPLEQGTGLVPLEPAKHVAMVAPTGQVVSAPDWPQITATGMQQYSATYTNGMISEQESRGIFTAPQVRQEVLPKVQNLPFGKDGSDLALGEFCIALHYEERFRDAGQLPQVFPPGLGHFGLPYHSHQQFVASRVVETQKVVVQGAGGNNTTTWVQKSSTASSLETGSPGKRDANIAQGPGTQVGVSEEALSPEPSDEVTTPGGHPRYKSQAPELDMSIVEQLSWDDRDALLTRLKEAEALGRQLWETEMELIHAKRAAESHWSKLQDVMVFNTRCRNQLAELDLLLQAEKTEMAMLIKRYDDKFQRTEAAMSRLQAEEVALHDLWVKKAELQTDIARLGCETGESEASLQSRADEIVADLEATRKAAASRSKSLGLHVQPTASELGVSKWDIPKLENVIEWDDEWTDFEDEGCYVVEDTPLDSPSSVLVSTLTEDLISFDSANESEQSESEDAAPRKDVETDRPGGDSKGGSTTTDIYSLLEDLFASSSPSPRVRRKEEKDVSDNIASLRLGSHSHRWKSPKRDISTGLRTLLSSPARQTDGLDFPTVNTLAWSIPIASVGPGSTR
ncbi:hypothetical protein CBR_g8947 [Chara braunii]|uniref:EF-hand domain-containing protein n=1 Tax=Chara braunii TaxID=69332 RepID=A0A388KN91_CHABU|nr:hypothetical protein CBR_g8947 [Chara braunii]|eukprot:GBG71529.1 hypothetical protein CBR_g8947 [Chara braunii]